MPTTAAAGSPQQARGLEEGVTRVNQAANEDYATELAEILELRDVPAPEVVRIVRGVESRLAESGEDPVAAFGTPGKYADNFAPRSRMVRFWILIASSVTLASGGTLLLISGVFGLLSPAHGLWGLPAWTRVVLGAAGITLFVALLLAEGVRARRRASGRTV